MGYELSIERPGKRIGKQEWQRAVKAVGSLRLGSQDMTEIEIEGHWLPVFWFVNGRVNFKLGTGYMRQVISCALELAKVLDARVVGDGGEEYTSPDQVTTEPDVSPSDPGVERDIKKAFDKKLPSLSLQYRFLKSVPESIRPLRDLVELVLFDNEIERLPDWLPDLSTLEFLNLATNRLTALPDGLGRLCRLRRLIVHDNRLVSLPDSLGDCRSLERLDLSRNEIARLPETFGKLAKLEELMAVSNRLESLPDSIGQLPKLRCLYLTGNRLNQLPDSICQLENLQILHLENNVLTELPRDLGELSPLKRLDLTGNQLQSLPESMRNLSLERLVLHGNEALGIPPDILGPTDEESDTCDDYGRKLGTPPHRILSWYFEQR